jgi:hypothetical protein
MAQNVWVKALDGRLIRVERITGLDIANIKGWGWTVIAELGRGRPAELAALGRGHRAKYGAERLCNEWPQATAAAGKDATITFVKDGYPKGAGQWSTLATPATPVRTIPAAPPGEARRRDTGTG